MVTWDARERPQSTRGCSPDAHLPSRAWGREIDLSHAGYGSTRSPRGKSILDKSPDRQHLCMSLTKDTLAHSSGNI